jgi:phosphotransferase family enzyme
VNRELRDLLAQAGYEHAARPGFRWHQVIVHRNIASVPPLRHAPGTALWNHGFNLILLGETGAPSHYAKCRSTSVRETHEATVLTILSADPALADIVPSFRSASSATLTVQVSQFIGDRSWDADSIRGDLTQWTRAVRGILETVRRLAERAIVLLPDHADRSMMRLEDALTPHLTTLRTAGLPNESLDVLATAAEMAPEVPKRPQHGDLWPANLIQRADGGWWVLDFEIYGRIGVPLHDVFHLVRTSALPDGDGTWVRQLAGAGEWARAQQQIMREAVVESGVPAAAITGLVIYYFAEMTARLYRYGTPRSFWEPYLAEIRDAVQHLEVSGTLEHLLLG